MRCDNHALDQLMRVALEQQAVLERTRLHLVRVADQVLRMRSVWPHWNEAPLHAGWKPSATTTAKGRLLHEIGDFGWCHAQRFLRSPIPAGCLICLEVRCLSITANVLRKRLIHRVRHLYVSSARSSFGGSRSRCKS